MRDQLPLREVKEQVLDSFDAIAIKTAKKILWSAQESRLHSKNKKWTEHRRTAQRQIEADLDDLVDYIACLDEEDQLPQVCVLADQLTSLPVAVIAVQNTGEARYNSSQSECLKDIQTKLETLSDELRQSLKVHDRIDASTGSTNELRQDLEVVHDRIDTSSNSTTIPVSAGLAGKSKPEAMPLDRSRNVIVFGVPESKSLLETELLVSRAFEFAVGRRIELADCFRLGRYNKHHEKSRPLLVKLASVWDRRLLLSSKYKLKSFSEAIVYVHEYQAPAKRNK